MKKLFDPDSPIMRFLTQAAELAWLNILWVVCSLPVFTIGASSAALCRTVGNLLREKGQWNAAAFFRAFRENFKKTTLLWLILLAALALIGADVFLLRSLFPEQTLWMALPGICFSVWLTVCIWVFPLTATFENTLWNTLKNALLLGVGYLPRTILMAAIHLLPAILFVVSPAAFYGVSILWLVLLSAVTCYTDLWLMQKPFAPFLPEEE